MAGKRKITYGTNSSSNKKSHLDKSNIDKMNVDKSNIDKSSIDKSSIDKMNVDKSNIDKMNVNKGSFNKGNIDKMNVEGNIDKSKINVDKGNIDNNQEYQDALPRKASHQGTREVRNTLQQISKMSKKDFHKIYDGAIKANLERQRFGNNENPNYDDLNIIIRTSLDVHYDYLIKIAADPIISSTWQDAIFLHPWVDFNLSSAILMLMFSPSNCARNNGKGGRDNDTYKQVVKNTGLEPNIIDILHLSPPVKNLPVYNDDCKYLARQPYVQLYYKECLDLTINLQKMISGNSSHLSAVYIGGTCAVIAAQMITDGAVVLSNEVMQYTSNSGKALLYIGQHLSYHMMNGGKTLHLFAFFCDVIACLFKATQSQSSNIDHIIRLFTTFLSERQEDHLKMHAEMIVKTTALFGAENVIIIKKYMPSIYHNNLKPSFDLMEILKDQSKEIRMKLFYSRLWTSVDIEAVKRLLSRPEIIAIEDAVFLIQQGSFICRADALLEMIIKNEHKLEASQLIELFHRDSFCCRADALLEMIIKNEHKLEASQLIELFHQDSFCCRADALLEMIIHRSHLISLKAILVMFHNSTFCTRADDALEMIIVLSNYFSESMVRSLLYPYHAAHLDNLIDNYKSSLQALQELWSSDSTCDDSVNSFISSNPMYTSSRVELIEQYIFRNKSKTWQDGYYNHTKQDLLTMCASFKIPDKIRKGKKCYLVDFLEQYDEGTNDA